MELPAFDPESVAGMVVFAEVARRGSFTQAAASLGLAKSVVSARVARLERVLGARLLHRTSRRVALTPAGTMLWPICERVALAAAEVRAASLQEAAEPQGRLRVNAPVSFGQRWIAPAIAALLARYPLLQVELVLQDDVVDVVGGGWDAVVRLGAVRDPELTARRFAVDHLVCVGSPAYLDRRGRPERPEALAGHVCLRYANVARHEEWRFHGPEGVVVVPVNGPLVSNDGALLAALAEAGAGLTIAPWFIVADAVRGGRLEAILGGFMGGELPCQVVHAHGRHPPARVRALVDHLVVSFRRPPWGHPPDARAKLRPADR